MSMYACTHSLYAYASPAHINPLRQPLTSRRGAHCLYVHSNTHFLMHTPHTSIPQGGLPCLGVAAYARTHCLYAFTTCVTRTLFMPTQIPHTSLPQGGLSCLGVAAYRGQIEVVKFLCNLGNRTLLTLKDNKGVSPLEDAKKMGHAEVVALLKTAGIKA